MADPELNVVVASSFAEMEPLCEFWAQHNRHPECARDFVAMLMNTRPQVIGPHVLMVCRGPTPIAMLVGRLERASLALRLGYRNALRVPMTQWVFVRDGFLGEQTERTAMALMEHLRGELRSGHADRILLSSLPLAGALQASARQVFSPLQRDGSARPGEHWQVHLPADFESFLARRSAKHRYALRRAARQFEALHPGQVRHQVCERPEDVMLFCEAAESVARGTYQRGLGAGFFDDDAHRQRLRLAAQRGELRGHVLFAGERPVAFWAGEVTGQVMYVAWTAFDPAFRRHEVGTIALLGMVEHLMAGGVRTIDFGPGGAAYKERFGDLCLHEQDVAVYAMTPKGLAARALAATMHGVNHAGRQLFDRLSIARRLKKSWRDRLSRQASAQRVSDAVPARTATPAGAPMQAGEGQLP